MATQRPEIFPSTAREVICVLTLCSSVATGTLGSGALQVALPQIGKYYGITGGDLTWIIASGTLTAGSFLLLCGSLSDIIGRKRMLVFSYAWFTIWNLAAGFANTHILFDIFRGLAGIGAIPACVGILGSTYQRGTRKNKAFAVLGGFQPLGYVFGIVTGGIATEFLSWQANVWFLAILFAFVTASAWFFVPSDEALLEHVRKQEAKGNRMSGIPPPPPEGTVLDKTVFQLLKQVDFIGAVLVTAGFALFVFALTSASKSTTGWRSAEILACLIIGVALVILFLIWQWYLGRPGSSSSVQPLMPLSIWTYPNLGLVMVIVTLGFINFTGVLMFWSTLWFQEINHVSPLVTTARYLPQVVGGLLVNLFAAFTLHIIPGKLLLVVGMAAFTVSTLLFALQPTHITYWAMSFPSLCLSVVGADLTYMVSNLFVNESVPNNLKSTAGAVFNTVITLATTIGLGAGAAVANSVANKGAHEGESYEDFLVRTYQSAFWFATGATIVGTFLCFFVKVGRQGHEKPGDVEDSGSEHAADGVVSAEKTNTKADKLQVDLEKEIGIHRSPEQSVMSLDIDDKISTKIHSPDISHFGSVKE
ncbi:hypothetical protein H072_408 [Dactylellina haptotyla CBS 200.50]|uniref:Major facilitator superfamily (MFS) profile domain-containing protein n=1 Tax=Dactylellina haptotyla (strain CBS 200.50) TaxID=1284197 RepID=S8AX97_DACHA|nr:hypothetical protein H072_408 [Dactylellina haptotyla CBS 200.50]